jgi:hypothetical protein
MFPKVKPMREHTPKPNGLPTQLLPPPAQQQQELCIPFADHPASKFNLGHTLHNPVNINFDCWVWHGGLCIKPFPLGASNIGISQMCATFPIIVTVKLVKCIITGASVPFSLCQTSFNCAIATLLAQFKNGCARQNFDFPLCF